MTPYHVVLIQHVMVVRLKGKRFDAAGSPVTTWEREQLTLGRRSKWMEQNGCESRGRKNKGKKSARTYFNYFIKVVSKTSFSAPPSVSLPNTSFQRRITSNHPFIHVLKRFGNFRNIQIAEPIFQISVRCERPEKRNIRYAQFRIIPPFTNSTPSFGP